MAAMDDIHLGPSMSFSDDIRRLLLDDDQRTDGPILCAGGRGMCGGGGVLACVHVWVFWGVDSTLAVIGTGGPSVHTTIGIHGHQQDYFGERLKSYTIHLREYSPLGIKMHPGVREYTSYK
eukprot:1179641-Prorocentrum_minimum.AAC.1